MRRRIVSERVQITTDGLSFYRNAIEESFGGDADFAQLEKVYRTDPRIPAGRYSPAVCIAAKRSRVNGHPTLTKRISQRPTSSRISRSGCRTAASPGSPPPSQRVSKPRPRPGAQFRLLQFRPHPQDPQGHASDGAGVSKTLWTMEDIAERIEARHPQARSAGPTRRPPELAGGRNGVLWRPNGARQSRNENTSEPTRL